MIRISIAEAGKPPRLLTYNTSVITLGRATEHDVCLTGKGVSGTHCRIAREGATYFIEDLGSTNGTYVNRLRVRGRQPITADDEVVLAVYRLRVLAESEAGEVVRPGSGMVPAATGAPPGPVVPEGVRPRPAMPTAQVPAPYDPPVGSADGGPPPGLAVGPGHPMAGVPVGPGPGAGPGHPPVGVPVGAPAASPADPMHPALVAWEREWEQIDKLATTWQAAGNDRGLLLRGDKLAHARRWLSQGRGKQPAPKPIHRDFIMAGAHARGSRTLIQILLGLGVLAVVGWGWWTWIREPSGTVEHDDDSLVDEGIEPDAGHGSVPSTNEPSQERSDALAKVAAGLLETNAIVGLLVATEAVARLPPDRALFEADAYRVLRASLRRLPGRPLRGHNASVDAVALSPQGRWAITAGGGRNGEIRIWDLFEPGVLQPKFLRGHAGELTAMEVSPDGRWLVTADSKGLAMRWNLQDSDPSSTSVRLADHRVSITSIDISHDGRWLVSGDQKGEVKTWNLDEPLPAALTLPKGPELSITDVAINADGTRVVASSGDMAARNWRLSDGQAGRPVVVPHDEVEVTTVALTDDDTWAVTGGSDGVVRLWSPTSRSPTRRWEKLAGHKGTISQLEITADSSLAVSVGDDHDLVAWDLKAKVPAASSVRLGGHTRQIITLDVYSPPPGSTPGRHVPTSAFTASVDGTARSWNLDKRKSGVESRVFTGHSGAVRSVAVSGDGQWAITGGEDRVARVWDWQSLPLAGDESVVGSASIIGRGHTSAVMAIAVEDYGRRLITGSADGTARVWDLGHPTRLLSLPVKDLHRDQVRAVAVSTKYAASGDDGGQLVLWEILGSTPKGLSLSGHTGEIGAVAFTADSSRLISVSTDRTARVWRLTEQPQDDVVVLEHRDEVSQLGLSRDGQWLLTGTLTSAALWDLNGELSAPTRRFADHEDDLTAVGIDPVGRWVATGSADRRVLLYDRHQDQASPHKLRKHEGTIQVIAFDPKAQWLATGSQDNSVRLWDLRSEYPGEESLALTGHEGWITDLRWSPDGRWLVSASNDGTIRLWDIRKPHASIVEDAIVLEANGKVIRQIGLLWGDEGLSAVASAGFDGTARLWPLAPAPLLLLGCTYAGRSLTAKEWSTHVGGEYRAVCRD